MPLPRSPASPAPPNPVRAAARSLTVDVVIPALNEQEALPHVLRAIPSLVRRTIVCDNGSTDRTYDIAHALGATVVRQPERGYGAACLRALAELESDPPDVVVFLDGDFSDDPGEIPALLATLERHRVDLVVGSRVLGPCEAGALTLPQRVGNALACLALRALYGARYTDLGPFRAVRYPALLQLDMRDRDYGWTVEMQVKAARCGLAHAEVPVSYRRRVAGTSKVSGTLRGVVGASGKILGVLLRHARPPR